MLAQTTVGPIYPTKLATATSYYGSTANVNGMVDGGNAGTFSNLYTGSAYAANFWFRHTGATVADFPAFSFPLTVSVLFPSAFPAPPWAASLMPVSVPVWWRTFTPTHQTTTAGASFCASSMTLTYTLDTTSNFQCTGCNVNPASWTGYSFQVLPILGTPL